MLTKQQATALANQYLGTAAARLNDLLEANARVGIVGCSFSYAGIPAQTVTNAKTALGNLGWTVTDDGAGTLTLS